MFTLPPIMKYLLSAEKITDTRFSKHVQNYLTLSDTAQENEQYLHSCKLSITAKLNCLADATFHIAISDYLF